MRLVHPIAVAVLSAVACADGVAASPAPLQAPIAIDGDAGDWAVVLATEANAARDGDGSSIPCTFSSDRDCVVDRGTNDLARFAWTWDSANLYIYLERWATEFTWRFFYVVLDVDRDGLAEAGEPVLHLHARSDAADSWLQQYVPSQPTGDPMVDGLGRADGHDLPGTVSGPSALPAPAVLDAGRAYEMAVPWAALGIAPDTPLDFHVIAAASSTLPGSTRDNMGRADGGVGTTARRAVTLSPGVEVSVVPGEVGRVTHRACNAGNVPSRLVVVARSGRGHDLTLRVDRNLDGNAEDFLGFDSGGDGSFSRSRDDLAPAGDSDGDGALDLGMLPGGTCHDVVMEESFGSNAAETETIQVVVTQQEATSVRAEATDIVRVGRVTLAGDVQRAASAGRSAWFSHVLSNNLDISARIDIAVVSPLGWTCTVHDDPNGDGTPDDATPALDDDGTGRPDIGLRSLESGSFFIEVAVPAGVPDGTLHVVGVQALVQGSVRASVADTVRVTAPVVLWPDHLADTGDARHGEAGGFAYFPHGLTNAQPRAANFRLEATSDLGWTVTFWRDPDGDGRPFDAELLPGWTGLVPGGGGEFRFLARVALPAALADGTTSRVRIRAEDVADATAADEVFDDAGVTVVRVFDDASLAVDVSAVAPCATARAVASGLAPSSQDHLFVWRDGTRAARRLTPATSDASGRCTDALPLAGTDEGAGWSVEIQRRDAGTYVVQDAASFDVEDPISAGVAATGSPSYHVVRRNLTASAPLANAALDRPAKGGDLRWVVLDPSRAWYLTPAGSFAPYSGVEVTARETMPDLPARSSWTARLAVADVSFATRGVHVVELHRELPCIETLATSVAFAVLDDEDGDGLEGPAEVAAGTDARDADSDDDGLTDGLDGLADFDGDGAIDALDCDSDDDGVLDGVEAGVWERHEDTFIGPCAFIDRWPFDTTDPDDPDTDGGGLSDGEEDLDADGKVDAGETDPGDPTDDDASDDGCSVAAPPEVDGLRVTRMGSLIRVTWRPIADPCVTYRAWTSTALPALTLEASGLATPEHVFAPAGALVFLVASATSRVSGDGPTGP